MFLQNNLNFVFLRWKVFLEKMCFYGRLYNDVKSRCNFPGNLVESLSGKGYTNSLLFFKMIAYSKLT